MGSLSEGITIGKNLTFLAKVPQALAEGVRNGEYNVIGGTVRYARGPYRGQIKGFLEIVDPTKSGGLPLLAGQSQAAILVPAVTAVAAFAYLAYQVAVIQRKLSELAKQVKEIRSILEERSLAELQASLSDLRRIKEFSPDQRISIAGEARFKLASLSNQFMLRFQNAKQAQEAAHALDLALAALLAHAYVYRLLDKEDLSIKELELASNRWKEGASRLTRSLLEPNASRFFFRQYEEIVPLSDLVAFLRLSYQEFDSEDLVLLEKVRPEPSGLFARLPTAIKKTLDKQRAQDESFVIPTLKKLTLQNQLLDAYSMSTRELAKRVPLADLEAGMLEMQEKATDGVVWIDLAPEEQPSV